MDLRVLSTCNEVDFYGSTCNEVELHVTFCKCNEVPTPGVFIFFRAIIIPLHTETAYTLRAESPRVNP